MYKTLQHISGIPNYGQNVEVGLGYDSRHSMFSIDKNKLLIPEDSIVSIDVRQSREVITEPKNTLGHIVAGSLIGGGIGAIVGGVAGSGTKTKDKDVLYLDIIYNSTSGIHTISLYTIYNIAKFKREIDKIKEKIGK